MTATAPATRWLHVANGTSTTVIISTTGIPGAVSIWPDPLLEGPVPGALTDGAMRDLRAGFLSGPVAATVVGPVNDMGAWRPVIENHEADDELVRWFEHDLFDQLNLIQLLTLIRERLPREKTVTLVCIGSFPGRPHFKGLGELTLNELESHVDTRQPVTGAQYALAEASWTAFRSATPEALDRLRRQDTSALPFLAPALRRFLQEYPWTSDGLSRSERRLLRLAEPGPIDLMQAFPRLHDGEDLYYITDRSLDVLAELLSSAAPALLTLLREPDTDGRPLRGAVALTDTGRDVLHGRRDRMATIGIDRWLGGVHLQAGADLWRGDDTRRAIMRA